jgi:hypothetical protein
MVLVGVFILLAARRESRGEVRYLSKRAIVINVMVSAPSFGVCSPIFGWQKKLRQKFSFGFRKKPRNHVVESFLPVTQISVVTSCHWPLATDLPRIVRLPAIHEESFDPG